MEKPLLDTLWVLVASALVFLMQGGFMCLESGLTRQKNSINVAMKNLSDLSISVVFFWAFGFALMFGTSHAGIFGTDGFLFSVNGITFMSAFFLFQVMFCSTATTIMSGAVAGRMCFAGYLLVAVILSGIIYPFFGHWVWNGLTEGVSRGWLGNLGFVDFAGSTVVHSIGGWVALAAVLILGPRTGRFTASTSFRRTSVPIATLGVILLWFGWFGFNGGSTLRFSDEVAGIILNTVLSGAAGCMFALGIGWFIRGFAKVEDMINGSLAGLVSITASCFAVSSIDAVVIGALGGSVMFFSSLALVRLQIDDAVGAIPVHLGAGIWGTLAVALFGDPALIGTGLSWFSQLGVQVLGVVVAFLWAFGVAYVLLKLLNALHPLRVSKKQEELGLNISEHRVGLFED
ncbi:MAG: ammonium transporter [Candidatus Woesearchaeota archaeon]|nr:ammonium transporter [Candidatus Woesearchaeota archaeon]